MYLLYFNLLIMYGDVHCIASEREMPMHFKFWNDSCKTGWSGNQWSFLIAKKPTRTIKRKSSEETMRIGTGAAEKWGSSTKIRHSYLNMAAQRTCWRKKRQTSIQKYAIRFISTIVDSDSTMYRKKVIYIQIYNKHNDFLHKMAGRLLTKTLELRIWWTFCSFMCYRMKICFSKHVHCVK